MMSDVDLKRNLVLTTITSLCVPTSSVPEFASLSSSISPLTPLTVTVLSGGLTNYSYKIEACNGMRLFAKLSFAYARWNESYEGEYSLDRTENEVLMMERFGAVALDGEIAKTLHLSDLTHPGISEDMKLLVTTWSDNDEQLSNQFIDGSCDVRVAKSLALAISKLHQLPFDPTFNDGVRGVYADVMTTTLSRIRLLTSSTPPDDMPRTNKFVGDLPDTPSHVFERAMENYSKREALVHSDVHGFNVLVEPKPSVSDSEFSQFGPNGNFTLVDWEMSYAGPIGRDTGIIAAFAIGCALSHAISGHPGAAADCLRFIDVYWSTYIEDRTKTEGAARGTELYRNTIGWAGVFLTFYVFLDIHLEFLPVPSGGKDYDVVKDSLGVLSMKLLRIGFSSCTDELDLEALKEEYESSVDSEVLFVQSTTQGRRPSRTRRSSILRDSVTVSDTYVQIPPSQTNPTFMSKVKHALDMQRLGRGIKGIFETPEDEKIVKWED